MSYYYAAIGNLPLAIGQVRMALETPNSNEVDRARFRSRLDQLIEYLPDEQYGFAVRKGNTELLEAVNEQLQSLRDDGTYDEIYNKYFSTN